jgi:hypothetical protein
MGMVVHGCNLSNLGGQTLGGPWFQVSQGKVHKTSSQQIKNWEQWDTPVTPATWRLGQIGGLWSRAA